MTQKEKCLDILKDGEWHNSLEFNRPDVAGWHGAQRISELIKDGHLIEKKKEGKFMLYRLVEKPEAEKMSPEYMKLKSKQKQTKFL